jgi:hypothetical protein
MTGFSSQQRAAILYRELGACSMLGTSKDCRGRAEVANHRAGRGIGGSREANTLENGCPLCNPCNLLIEQDAVLAEVARRLGVKVSRHVDPASVPIWSPYYGQWVVYAEGSMFLTGERDSSLDARDLVVSGDRVAGFRVSLVNRSADQAMGAVG